MLGRSLGRFQVLDALGEGGLATVWKARDTLLGRIVALKVLKPELAREPHARRRFLNEARSASRLNHPSIVSIFEYGEYEDVVAIAMTHVAGETASDRAARSLVPVAEAVRVVRCAADALDHAHKNGVIHRDISGHNIMIAEDGRVYVLDFGLALAAGESRITSTGTIMGTPIYMAPEVLSARPCSAQGDLYGLGVVLFELLTGELPYPVVHPDAVREAALHGTPRAVRALRPEVPEAIGSVIERLLRKSPEERYGTAAELVEALAMGAARPAPPDSRAARAAAVAPAPPLGPAERRMYLALLACGAEGTLPEERTAAERIARRIPTLLAAALAGAPRLAVLAAGAARGDDPAATARAQGANAWLDGAVVCSGTQVRVTARIVDAWSGASLAGGIVDGSTLLHLDLEDRLVAAVRAWVAAEEPVAGGRARKLSESASLDRYAQALANLRRYDREAMVDGALGLLERLRELHPDWPRLHAAYARACLHKFEHTRERQWESRAASACDQAVRSDPDAPEVLLAVGEVKAHFGALGEARAAFEAARVRQPDLIEAAIGLQNVLRLSGCGPESVVGATAVVEQWPGDWRAHSMLGSLLYHAGRLEEAITSFRSVVRLTPDNARGWRNLGAALYRMGRPDAALEAFHMSLDLEPDARAYTNLGTVLHYMHRPEEAAEAFRKATGLAPTDPDAWGNLGNALHFDPARADEAHVALDQAIALMRERLDANPGLADGWARMAGWLANQGHRETARESMDRALTLAPDDVAVLMHGARVYLQLDDRGRAIGCLVEAVRRGHGLEEVRGDVELAPLRDAPEVMALFEGREVSEPGTAGDQPERRPQ